MGGGPTFLLFFSLRYPLLSISPLLRPNLLSLIPLFLPLLLRPVISAPYSLIVDPFSPATTTTTTTTTSSSSSSSSSVFFFSFSVVSKTRVVPVGIALHCSLMYRIPVSDVRRCRRRRLSVFLRPFISHVASNDRSSPLCFRVVFFYKIDPAQLDTPHKSSFDPFTKSEFRP